MKISYTNWSTDVFHGFYCSELDIGEYEYNASNNDEYEYEIPTDKIKEFMEDVAKAHTNNISDNLPNDSIVKILGFESLYSPKYYNYSTDSITMGVEFEEDKLEGYAFGSAKFAKYLADNFTTRDGFVSFVPNNIREFKEYKDLNKANYFDVLVEFYLLENVNFDDVHWNTCDNFTELFYEYAESKIKED